MPARVMLTWAEAREPWPGAWMTAALQRLPPAMGRDMARCRNPLDRQSRVLGRLLVRLALETMGVSAADLAGWSVDRFGRPYLAGCAADCSVSHSGGLVAAAVSLPGRVGLDVEVVTPLPIEALDAAFSSEEMADIRSAGDQTRRALELWTGKEATLKADGRGLSLDPTLVDARGETLRLGGETWRIVRPELTPGWLCALATNQATPVVDIIRTDLASLLDGGRSCLSCFPGDPPGREKGM